MLKKYLEQQKRKYEEKLSCLKREAEAFENSEDVKEIISFNVEEHKKKVDELTKELEEVVRQLATLEQEEEKEKIKNRKDNKPMNTRKQFYAELAERNKDFIKEFQSLVSRGVAGGKLAVPFEVLDVVFDTLKENPILSLCTLINSEKQGRVVLLTEFPEAFWAEKSGVDQSKNYAVHKVDFSDYTLEQYLAIAQNDEEDLGRLLDEIVGLMAQSIARKLAKDILNGDGDRCPVGILTAINASVEPAWHSATTVPFANISADHKLEVTLKDKSTIADYMKIVKSLKKAKEHGKDKFTVLMSRKTYEALAALVATVPEWRVSLLSDNALPLLPNVVLCEECGNNIVAGYFENYAIVVRRNTVIETSRDYKFAENQTCIKLTKRVDGRPLFADSFATVVVTTTEL